jgi:enoyl-CoA hydratase/carnithine racemase
MILTSLIIAAAAALAIGAVVNYWDSIKQWLHKAVQKAQELLDVAVLGVKVFIKKMKEAYEEIVKTYQQDKHGQWHQTTVTRKISASEVPPEILAKAKMQQAEVDVSNEVEKRLQLMI